MYPHFVATPREGSLFKYILTPSFSESAGRQAATNVRLRHNILPDFNIWPVVLNHVEDLNGAREIVIPTLVPGEEIIISYLYFPPLTYAQINAGIRCDQGFAQQIPVLLQRQYSKRFNMLVGALLVLGIIAAVYLAYFATRFVLQHLY